MCTVVVAFHPGAEVPLLLAAVRDELVERAWERPGRHWPEHPGLLGGRDVRAGGTWLAAAVEERGVHGPRVAAVLNGRPPAGPAPAGGEVAPSGAARLSRGHLPLRTAAHGKPETDPEELRRYDPFHLLVADAGTAVLYSWDGRELSERALPPGVRVLVNSGMDETEPRARRYGPAFAATRPEPGARTLREASTPEEVWGEWPHLVDEAARGTARTGGLEDTDDPSSLVARVDLGDGHVWASTSVTLVAVARDTVRYAFTGTPGDPMTWQMVR